MHDDPKIKCLQILSDGLAPFGFKLAPKSCMFFRVMNSEIVQSIYLRPVDMSRLGTYTFTVETAVSSIYILRLGTSAFYGYKRMMYQFLSEAEQAAVPWQSYFFMLNGRDTDTVISQNILNEIIRLIVPQYNSVDTLAKYIDYCFQYGMADMYLERPTAHDNLVWFALHDELNIEGLIDFVIPTIYRIRKAANEEKELTDMEIRREAEKYLMDNFIGPVRCIFDNPARLDDAKAEMELRRKKNIAFLRKNGIDV